MAEDFLCSRIVGAGAVEHGCGRVPGFMRGMMHVKVLHDGVKAAAHSAVSVGISRFLLADILLAAFDSLHKPRINAFVDRYWPVPACVGL